MSVMVTKTDFLQKLESVKNGLSPKPEILQSNCLVFRGGRVVTFDGNVMFRCKSGLPAKLTAVVPGKDLITTLQKISADTMVVRAGTQGDEGALFFAQKNEEVWVRMEDTVTLPIDQIDKPRAWRELPTDFCEAVGVVHDCLHEDPSKDLGHVHVTPKWVEAADTIHAARYRMKTGFDAPVLMRGDAMRHVHQLGMTKVGLTDTWIHFRNPTGLSVAVRRTSADATYPDIGGSFDVPDGRQVTLPPGLAEAVELAGVWAQQIKDDDKSGSVLLELRKGACRVTGLGVNGGYRRKLKLDYAGRGLAFRVPIRVLETVCKKYNEVLVNENKLAVVAGRWKYVTSLVPADAAGGKYGEPTPPTEDDNESD